MLLQQLYPPLLLYARPSYPGFQQGSHNAGQLSDAESASYIDPE